MEKQRRDYEFTHDDMSGMICSSNSRSSFQPFCSSILFHRICSVLSVKGKTKFPHVHNIGSAFWHVISPPGFTDTAIVFFIKFQSFLMHSMTSSSILEGSITLHFINCFRSQNRFVSYVDNSTIGSHTISYI